MAERNKDNIVELISKMLNMTVENGCTESEAKVALLKAHELMAKHNVYVSQVEDKPEEIVRGIMSSAQNQAKWKLDLAAVLAESFCCKVYVSTFREMNFDTRKFEKSRRVTFIGRKTNVETLKVVYEATYKICHKLALSYSVKNKGGYQSFVAGFLMGVRIELDAQCKALMVIVPQEVEEAFSNINFAKSKGVGGKLDVEDAEAYFEGTRAGQEHISKTKSIEGEE